MSDRQKLSAHHEAYIARKQRNPLNGYLPLILLVYVLCWTYAGYVATGYLKAILMWLLAGLPLVALVLREGRRSSR